MKKVFLFGLSLATIIIFLAYSIVPSEADKELENGISKELSGEFKQYWYSGDAEITSFQLEQVRYGEIHSGKAVMVYVTEPFSKTKQVKVDNQGKGDVSVMKLNSTKKFNTGIYPYSMMTSTFVPVKEKNPQALKVTTTSQEWCGHTFTQLNNRKGRFQIESRSYFESEGDQDITLEKTIIEDELWTQIRLNPEKLPVGDHKVLPSFFYLRLRHKPLKSYQAIIRKQFIEHNRIAYEINYPGLNRELKIVFSDSFPFEILEWQETYKSGWGPNAKTMTTKASRIKTIKTDYWTKHSNEDLPLRDELGL
ncbi:MAG: septum formation inhibitor Maf [Bacteroidetes bacterium]|nr:MAG: septum formation inhibitor Maf [Bacteroidota bacterium]